MIIYASSDKDDKSNDKQLQNVRLLNSNREVGNNHHKKRKRTQHYSERKLKSGESITIQIFLKHFIK